MALARPIRRGIAALLLAPAVLCTAGAQPVKTDADETPQARAEALWREGAALHIEGRYESAMERFHEALDLHPTARTHTWLAWSLSYLDKYQEAVDHCRSAIEINPEYPNAYNDLGSYLIELDRPREAEPWLRKATELEDYCCPHYAWYHLARSMVLQGRFEEAYEALEASLEHEPRYRPALQLLRLLRMHELQAV